MAKAATKSDLIKSANEQFDKLWKIIDLMNDQEQNCVFSSDLENAGNEAHWKRDKNLRDVLVHLYEWHQLLLEWENSNSLGIDKSFLPSPYTWKSYSKMNLNFWQKHQNTSLLRAKEILKESHENVLKIIEKYNDECLFTKAYFKWTGSTSFGQYCISATISHYDWAIKKLKTQSKYSKK